MSEEKVEMQKETNYVTIYKNEDKKGVITPIQIEFFTCACYSDEHLLQVSYDSDENDLWVEVHLSHENFLKRVWKAIKYICGYKCRYGCFQTWLLNNDHTDRMIELLQKKKIRHQEIMNKWNEEHKAKGLNT